MSLYEIYYVVFNALEKCPSVVLKKHDHFRRMIEKSSANRSWEAKRQGKSFQSMDSKSMCSDEITKSYTSMMQGSLSRSETTSLSRRGKKIM